MIPGIKAKHAEITDVCRRNRGDHPAFEEAVNRLFDEYKELLRIWPIGTGRRFHVVLTVEHPADNPDDT